MPSGKKGTLYVVATPIGNLADMSPRCRDVLRAVDIVAAEDTRRTVTLLREVGSRAKLESYHGHSTSARAHRMVQRLLAGSDIALVTDAGTPAVSDPGSQLIDSARSSGAQIVPVPGPSAVAVALSASGFSADRYTFLGFLPRKGKARRKLVNAIVTAEWTTVFFESPTRLTDTLKELSGNLEDGRRVMVGREMSKIYEEFRVGTPEELAVYYEQEPPRGEVTVVVEAGSATTAPLDSELIEARGRELLSQGKTRKDVVAALVSELGAPRNDVYRIVTGL